MKNQIIAMLVAATTFGQGVMATTASEKNLVHHQVEAKLPMHNVLCFKNQIKMLAQKKKNMLAQKKQMKQLAQKGNSTLNAHQRLAQRGHLQGKMAQIDMKLANMRANQLAQMKHQFREKRIVATSNFVKYPAQ